MSMEGGDFALWNPIGSLNVFKFWVMLASPCMDSGSTSILRGDFKVIIMCGSVLGWDREDWGRSGRGPHQLRRSISMDMVTASATSVKLTNCRKKETHDSSNVGGYAKSPVPE